MDPELGRRGLEIVMRQPQFRATGLSLGQVDDLRHRVLGIVERGTSTEIFALIEDCTRRRVPVLALGQHRMRRTIANSLRADLVRVIAAPDERPLARELQRAFADVAEGMPTRVMDVVRASNVSLPDILMLLVRTDADTAAASLATHATHEELMDFELLLSREDPDPPPFPRTLHVCVRRVLDHDNVGGHADGFHWHGLCVRMAEDTTIPVVYLNALNLALATEWDDDEDNESQYMPFNARTVRMLRTMHDAQGPVLDARGRVVIARVNQRRYHTQDDRRTFVRDTILVAEAIDLFPTWFSGENRQEFSLDLVDAVAEDTLHDVCLRRNWRDFVDADVVRDSGWREGIRLIRDAERRIATNE